MLRRPTDRPHRRRLFRRSSTPELRSGAESIRTDVAAAAVKTTAAPRRPRPLPRSEEPVECCVVRSPLVRRMLELVLAEPILITPEERYLYGHYLAYLLSGSRRRGLFLRRPLEPRNADRAQADSGSDLRHHGRRDRRSRRASGRTPGRAWKCERSCRRLSCPSIFITERAPAGEVIPPNAQGHRRPECLRPEENARSAWSA